MDATLWGLLASAYVSSTSPPGNSENRVDAVLKAGASAPTAVAVATVGNTLGGMTTYALGRLLPSRLPEGRAIARVRRFGAAALLLSWLPFAGDALCAAAGWLRLNWLACALAMALGKAARYVVVAHATTSL